MIAATYEGRYSEGYSIPGGDEKQHHGQGNPLGVDDRTVALHLGINGM
jgi:hypothetical protein